MKALVTGASGGIGRDIAKVLAARGCELVLCARNEEKLKETAAELGVPARVIALDLSREENCRKLYEMTKNDGIDILVNNAGFGVFGPLMAGYYASKNYVTRLSEAVAEELRREGSGVKISVLCPGPVKTGFNARAGVKFNLRSADSAETARVAVDGMFAGKLLVTPLFGYRALEVLSRFLPRVLVARIVYFLQRKKGAR